MQKVGGASMTSAHRGILCLALAIIFAVAPQVQAACNCSVGYSFLAERKIRFNNDSVIVGNVGVNSVKGLLRFGRFSCQGSTEISPCTGNTTYNAANKIIVGEQTSVAGTESNILKLGVGAVVRNPPLLTVGLPLVPGPVCGAFTPVVCGGADVLVPTGGNLVALAPGSYDTLLMGNGSTLTLQPGTYSFCSVKIGSGATVNVDPSTEVNVAGKFSLGSGTVVDTGSTPFVLNVEGTLVRVSQNAVLVAEVRSPNAKIKLQRDSELRGCSCSSTMVTDKGTSNVCVPSSPSGAFVD